MSLFPAIENYLPHQGAKYISPDKAGQLRESMLELRAKGQAARKEFADLVKDFQSLYPKLTLERTSQWMNQAQILGPIFGIILKAMGKSQNLCLPCACMELQKILGYRWR